MKSLSRTIIVLSVLGVAMGGSSGSSRLPGEAVDVVQPGIAEQAPRSPGVAVEPVVPARVPAPSEPPREAVPVSTRPSRPSRPYGRSSGRGAAMMALPSTLGRSDARRVLVVPTDELNGEDLAAIGEDMLVMSHILDKSKGSQEDTRRYNRAEGLFVDFGPFFRRVSRVTDAIYLQGYGALFLMEASLPLSVPSEDEKQEHQAEQEKEDVDPVWQMTRSRILSPEPSSDEPQADEERDYDPEEIAELKRELVRTLKHAANIRHLKADEWVVLTITGKPQLPAGDAHDFNRFSYEQLMYGGMMDARLGLEAQLLGTPPLSVTVVTMRAKKSDVDAFAKGTLDFEQFHQRVKVLEYPDIRAASVAGRSSAYGDYYGPVSRTRQR